MFLSSGFVEAAAFSMWDVLFWNAWQYDKVIPQEINSQIGTEIYEQLCRHTIVILESELDGKPINDYHISLSIHPEEQDRCSYVIQFVNVKQRESYQMRKYSYQIMRQLFKTFTHEFGTCLNY